MNLEANITESPGRRPHVIETLQGETERTDATVEGAHPFVRSQIFDAARRVALQEALRSLDARKRVLAGGHVYGDRRAVGGSAKEAC
jgi:hypothetical protein